MPRLKLFEQNYKLLEKFVPELLTNEEPNFYLKHKSENTHFENATAEWQAENELLIGTFYTFCMVDGYNAPDGDTVSDPAITVIFDIERKLARVKSLVVANIGMQSIGAAIYNDFDCAIDSKEANEDERSANDYLGDWLKMMIQAKKGDTNYFVKINASGA